jgi:hypothetical protein
MQYLFADGTPFPLSLNAIELIKDAIDCAADLLRIHERQVGARRRLAEAEEKSNRGVQSLRELQEAISCVTQQTQCEGAAQRIRASVRPRRTR